jgi:hypothetical protein
MAPIPAASSQAVDIAAVPLALKPLLPAQGLLSYARNSGGSGLDRHGDACRTRLGHLLMGRVAAQVIRTALCRVLTIRPTATTTERGYHLALKANQRTALDTGSKREDSADGR